ncbi:Autophagy-related protein like [Actinidia chinensis var. chinensis]|uniref:Autophagy-related protein like n=1 Tax=Actinidia chinensis var. chinensis TaxID=1590841 RepID=A0A2R6RJU8_ACTCC|nr:Autophagy-related protein like [Actinidia chinensis var. chinensis]
MSMALYHGNTQSSEAAKMEQIITEFFAKSRQIILESRCPHVSSRNYSGEQMMSSPSPSSSSSSSSSIRGRDKWFNLALRDCPAAIESIDFWRQSNLEPMVVDIILVQRLSDWDPMSYSPRRDLVRNLSGKERFQNCWSSEDDEFGCDMKTEKIIERWVVQYESRKGGRDCSSGSKRSIAPSLHTLYKKSILLLRSLYAMVRLLPAYKLYRDLISSGQILTFNLAHRVSSFVEPFTHREESEMQQFEFTPVETFSGRLCLSVTYRSSLLDVSSEPSTPMTPQFIQDYVGSPMADPLKRLLSFPVPQGSPCSSPFGRRHSWSHDFYTPSPPSALPSPSPAYSDSRASISKPSSHCLPPRSLPRHLPETPQRHKNNTNLDAYWPSIFSPSPSTSPPAHLPSSHKSKALLRSESAPVSIPASKLGSTPLSNNNQILPRSPPLKVKRNSASKTQRSSGLVQTSTVDKLFSFGKYENKRCSGSSGVKLSSNSSPQKSFSRSSSKLSFQDDFDDSEFSGPFVVDDDDMADRGSRPGSFDQRGLIRDPLEPRGLFQVRKSQDAAVAALVHVLKRAPPLRQDISNSIDLSPSSSHVTLTNPTEERNEKSELRVQSAVISVASPKTTSAALEELRGYREMKDLLLRQKGMRSHTQAK